MKTNISESHKNKKQNPPKSVIAAIRKGNRDAERDIYGDGFKKKTTTWKTSKRDKAPSKRVNMDKLDEAIDWAIKKVLNLK